MCKYYSDKKPLQFGQTVNKSCLSMYVSMISTLEQQLPVGSFCGSSLNFIWSVYTAEHGFLDNLPTNIR